MDPKLTIGKVAHQSGTPIPTIRFYEGQGVIPAPERTDGGYRLYSPNDVRRLRLARRARLLGLSLPEVKELVDRAFSSECDAYANQVVQLVSAQRARIDRQMAELQALRAELDGLEQDARRISADAPPGLTVAECPHCLLVDGESGERGYCNCAPTPRPISTETLRGMPMTEQLRPETLETLVCELGRRPKDAPAIGDVVGSVRAVRREADALTVDFDPAAAELVAAVVDAERQCCSTLGWHLERDPEVRLRITAKPLQLETLEAMFSPSPAT